MALLSPEFSIVLPAHNEAANIAPMVGRLEGDRWRRSDAPRSSSSTTVSSDGTLAALRAAAAGDPCVRYVSFTRNFGHQAALRAGLRHARGRAVVVMDADFEHPPELIPELVAHWREGAKIVATQRIDDEAVSRAIKRLELATLLPPARRHRRRAHRARQRRLHAARPRRGRRRQRARGPGHLPARPGALARLSAGHGAVRARRCGVQGDSKYSLRRMVELAITGIAAHSVRPLRFAVWLCARLRGARLAAGRSIRS